MELFRVTIGGEITLGCVAIQLAKTINTQLKYVLSLHDASESGRKLMHEAPVESCTLLPEKLEAMGKLL